MEGDFNLPIRFSSGPEIRGTRITEDYPNLFGDSYQAANTYDIPTSSLDAICHPFPASDHPLSSLQEAAYEGNQLSNNGNYNSGFGGCRRKRLFSYNHGSNGIGAEYGGSLVPSEHARQNEEHYDTDFSYHENNEIQPAVDYNTCYESCSGFTEDIFNYNEQEPRPTYGYSQEEMEFCESIFSYWPCLLREMRQSYVP